MNFNCKWFRLSSYQEHKVTGLPPLREVTFVRYTSGDNGGTQRNYALKLGLTTWHLKVRYGREVLK